MLSKARAYTLSNQSGALNKKIYPSPSRSLFTSTLCSALAIFKRHKHCHKRFLLWNKMLALRCSISLQLSSHPTSRLIPSTLSVANSKQRSWALTPLSQQQRSLLIDRLSKSMVQGLQLTRRLLMQRLALTQPSCSGSSRVTRQLKWRFLLRSTSSALSSQSLVLTRLSHQTLLIIPLSLPSLQVIGQNQSLKKLQKHKIPSLLSQMEKAVAQVQVNLGKDLCVGCKLIRKKKSLSNGLGTMIHSYLITAGLRL